MTAKQCWEGLLTELSKVNAPSLLLSEFNYFFNKAINLYINKRYNIYDVNQQLTDDLRVLKATSVLKPNKVFGGENSTDAYSSITGDLEPKDLVELLGGQSNLFGATYEVNLPLDYLHVLNCVCIYKMKSRFKCYDKDDVVQFGAKRLTADVWSVIINDYYNRPLPERPYYYIHNVNLSSDLPTNPMSESTLLDRTFTGTDPVLGVKSENGDTTEQKTDDTTEQKAIEAPRSISIKKLSSSVVERDAGVRYGNPTNVRMEIRYGSDDSVFELQAVLIDYIKSPQVIRLTLKLVNLTQDESLIMEFPDYVCLEIINELVHLVMETSGDPRLLTHAVVTESIASPVQQLTKTKA